MIVIELLLRSRFFTLTMLLLQKENVEFYFQSLIKPALIIQIHSVLVNVLWPNGQV